MKTGIRALILIASLATPASAQLVGGAPAFTVEKFDIGGTGRTDYLTAEPSTGRVFVSRETHVMVIDGRTGKVLGDIPNTPGVHGIALNFKSNRGFTTNAGDSTVSMFDLTTLQVVKKVKVPVGGLDGIYFDAVNGLIILTNHSKPRGTATFLDANDGSVLGNVNLADTSPEAAIVDDQGRLYIANEASSSVQVINVKTRKVLRTWPVAPCVGPTGLGIDLRTSRLFVGCSKKSVVLDYNTGKVIASIVNGDGVDGLAWDAGDHLMYIPSGKSGSITVVRMISPNSYKVVSTIETVPGAKTIAHDPSSRVVYQFQPLGDKNWFVRISR